MKPIPLFVCAAATLLASPVAAHPGHGDPGLGGWLHYLSQPEHFFVLAAVVMAGAAAATLLHARRRSAARRTHGR